jgi:regulator of replication initiation timing
MFNRKLKNEIRTLKAENAGLNMQNEILKQIIDRETAKRRNAARKGWETKRAKAEDERQKTTTTTNEKGE